MVKSKSNSIKLHHLWILGFTFIFTLSQCNDKFSQEIQHVEGLESQLKDNQENLNIDIDLFRSRVAYIEQTLRIFANDYPTTMSLELGNQLSKFKGLKKIYTKQIGHYESNLKEQAELELQLKNLKTDLHNSSITKKQFIQYVKLEQQDLEVLLDRSSQVKKLLYETEPDYMRLTKVLEKEMDRLSLTPLP